MVGTGFAMSLCVIDQEVFVSSNSAPMDAEQVAQFIVENMVGVVTSA